MIHIRIEFVGDYFCIYFFRNVCSFYMGCRLKEVLFFRVVVFTYWKLEEVSRMNIGIIVFWFQSRETFFGGNYDISYYLVTYR